MKYKVITPVATEPVTLAEALLHVRITYDEESPDAVAEKALLERLITAAREYCEKLTGRALAQQTLEAYPVFPNLDRFELPLAAPLESVISMTYIDSTGITTNMTESTDFLVDTDSEVGGIVLPYGKTWPQFTPYPINPIKVRYIAGYDSSVLIPKSIKQAMLLLIGHWYANRETVIIGSISKELEFSVRSLLSAYRVRRFV